MDFSTKNIKEILKYSLPKRFQDMSPTDFEDFVAQLFQDLGYKVEQTSYSGDFGADLVASKAGKRIAVQVKRYAKSNNVGVSDVNQVIGSKDYYTCDTALILTTSDFTNPALSLIEKSNVEKWNWNDLQRKICETYLDGKDVYEFFPDLANDTNKDVLKFEVTRIQYNVDMKQIGACTLVFANLKNSGANTDVTLALPILITQSNKQVEAAYWYEGYFATGTVYSDATAEVAFMFSSAQVNKIAVGDRIIFNLYQDGSELEAFDTTVNINSFGGCYVATACFGKDSREYKELIYFRDNFLAQASLGKKFICQYYEYGGVLIAFLGNFPTARLISRLALKIICFPISILNHYLRKIA